MELMLSWCKSAQLHFNIRTNSGLRSDPRGPSVLQSCMVDNFEAVRLNGSLPQGISYFLGWLPHKLELNTLLVVVM